MIIKKKYKFLTKLQGIKSLTPTTTQISYNVIFSHYSSGLAHETFK